ncbi:hypothetical protein FPV67DRAFT_1624192 [Lyophyllum atratum]|nr:hypothetical protein FPV67DRAFT_1624192 [Lyophyllum atratum]
MDLYRARLNLPFSLSPACTNTLLAVAANPDASACLSLNALVPVVIGSANTSVVPGINSWLTSTCGAAPCSNATLSALVTNVTTGCATELSLTGMSPSISSGIITVAQQYYPTIRKVLCLKDSDTNCITKTLTNIENITGPLSISSVVALALNPNVNQIPSNITCSNCIKAAYTIINHDIPSLVSDAGPSAQSQCGASFIDGTTPSGISQSAVEPTKLASSGLGFVSLSSGGAIFGVLASCLLVASTALLFLT